MTQIPAPQAPQTPPPDFPVIVETGIAWGEFAPAVAFVAFAIGSVMLLLPIVRAWARRIEGRSHDVATFDEVSQLRDRVAELDNMAARVHELEERLDFAERMLIQRDNAALPPRPGAA